LLSAPLAYAIARFVCTHDQFRELVPMTPRLAMLTVGYAILLAVGLAVSV
jgi:1,4-dihydroxy-2-naphthoate octaprenyltransferase